MSLVTSHQLLSAARAGGYAILAFSVDNMESVQGALEAAHELEAPIILQTGQGALKQTRMSVLARLIRAEAEGAKIPVVLHLDHGRDLDQVIQALRCGYTSVMYDGSHLPFAENVKRTREVVRVAKAVGIPVEGELGGIGRFGEAEVVEMTDPDDARRFVAETGVDSLAVAAGNVHAAYGHVVRLEIERLEAIGRQVDLPLVLHGGTGVSDTDLRAAIKAGVSKFNVATQWRRMWVEHCRGLFHRGEALKDWYQLMKELRDIVKGIALEKIRLLGSEGRAG